MTALKINVSRLPYRGKPTTDRKPTASPLPTDCEIIRLDGFSEWQKMHENHKPNPPKPIEKNYRRDDRWTDEEKRKAIKLYYSGMQYVDMEKEVGRPRKSIQTFISKQIKAGKVVMRKREGTRGRSYTPEEDDEIMKMYALGYSTIQIAAALNRSQNGIWSRLRLLT